MFLKGVEWLAGRVMKSHRQAKIKAWLRNDEDECYLIISHFKKAGIATLLVLQKMFEENGKLIGKFWVHPSCQHICTVYGILVLSLKH